MNSASSRAARSWAAIVSLLAAGSLVAQVMGNIGRGQELLPTVGWMLQYFTIWGNCAAGVVFAWIAAGRRIEPRFTFSLAAALVIIAAVYHLLLAADHHPEGVDWWTNIAHHTLVPAGGVSWWLFFSSDTLVGWRSLPVVTAVPFAYGGFALANGAVTGFYPYFFLDLPSLGWGTLLLNMVGLAILFMVVAALLLSLRKLIRAIS